MCSVYVRVWDSPVETERVQEGGQAFHDEQDAHGEHGEGREDDWQAEEAASAPGG